MADNSLRPEQNAYHLQHMLVQTMGPFSGIMLNYNGFREWLFYQALFSKLIILG